ncbi:response regulator transcription factor [candidate division WWE3 bacterium]|nr:response regulator transcription factor [candidate division WWE3 bacterium]
MLHSILLVEDDKGLQKYLAELLLEQNFSVDVASSGAKALSLIEAKRPDIVILDLGLPDISGETICTEIRKHHPDTPIIILTARDAVADVVQGLNLGADDYITKPFSADELVARINARLRQIDTTDQTLQVGDLTLNTETHEVSRHDKKIDLTPQEFKLLHYLMSNKNRILSREMILNRLWAYAPDIETRVVDVYIGYLRKKIDQDHPNPLIQSVRGFGYMIKDKSNS